MGGIKYNTRNTEINAANQAAQRQAQIAAGQKMIADNPQGLAPNVNNLAPPVTGVPKQQLNQSGFQTYDATTGKTTVAAPLGEIDQSALKRLMDSGLSEGQARERITGMRPEVAKTMSNTGLGGTAGQSAVVTPQQSADKAESDVRARYSRATATGSSVNPADVERDVQTARQNALKQAEIEQNNMKMQKDKEASTAGTDVTTPKPSGLDAALSSLSPEEQSILAPLIQSLQDQTTKGLTENAARTKAMLEGGTIDGVQVEGMNTIRDQLKSEIDGMKDDRKTMKDAVAEILKETKEDNEKLINEQEKAAQERLTWAQHKQDVDLARQKTKTHESLIAQYALGGGFGQDAALTQVRESDASFDSALRDVQTEFGIQRTELSAKFTGLYVANNNEYRTASIKNAEDYLSALERLNAQGGQNTIAFMNAQNGIIEKSQAEQTRLTENLAKNNLDIGKEMLTMINQKRDDNRAQEKLGWDILDDAVARYGSLIPKSTIDRVSKMLPAGTDIKDYINTPTIAERNSKRISGSGGLNRGSGSVPSGKDATASVIYSNVTTDQLREAVKRAFSPANYGGTAGERVTRENEYMSRIASGEAPSSIMQSLTADYWSSQKGAPRTAHDGRTEAQASAESLQSYVDSYGIESGDDGSLGSIDSRVQGLLSIFDASSEEYNNLATNVGNIRARIIKENYGAAVTPQELEIAKSYIPSMTDKGGVFVTKLQNLKAYQAYLDAKVSANSLGLPAPTPPTPVKLSGDKMSGAAKYSTDDITSALNAP